MRKMFLFVLAAAALLLMVPAQNAQAQSETPKVEIGMHYSHLRLRDFGTGDHGVGFRLTINVTDAFGIEGEVNSFPRGRDNLAAPTGFALRF
ncbi:MAG TPA: outer membrane beta-barrel protein [Blastocatellia bacterium]|nr:outer membrane beta-barrel protein [Blastocatellia bacterium]